MKIPVNHAVFSGVPKLLDTVIAVITNFSLELNFLLFVLVKKIPRF